MNVFPSIISAISEISKHKNCHTVIISGDVGSGKTTLAEMLLISDIVSISNNSNKKFTYYLDNYDFIPKELLSKINIFKLSEAGNKYTKDGGSIIENSSIDYYSYRGMVSNKLSSSLGSSISETRGFYIIKDEGVEHLIETILRYETNVVLCELPKDRNGYPTVKVVRSNIWE